VADKPEPQEVMKRLREDLRDVVDVAVDALSKAFTTVGSAVSQVGAGERPTENLETAALPAVPPSRPAGAGEQLNTRVTISNDSAEATEPFELTAADLVSPEGERIPAAAIELAHETRVVAGNSSDLVAVTVNVPGDAKPGRYSGQLQATNGATGPAELVVEVS
jgi:hypothetical protein